MLIRDLRSFPYKISGSLRGDSQNWLLFTHHKNAKSLNLIALKALKLQKSVKKCKYIHRAELDAICNLQIAICIECEVKSESNMLFWLAKFSNQS